MADNKFTGVMGSLLSGMDSILSTKTVVGQPTEIGDTIILPLVDVTFGIGAGASEKEKAGSGMGGLAGKMTPSAVLVIKNGQTKLVNIRNQDTITKIIDMVPDLLDRFVGSGQDMPSDTEAVEAAFSDDAKDAGPAFPENMEIVDVSAKKDI